MRVMAAMSDGVTGRIVGSVDEAVEALPALLAIDRAGCRRRFEQRFTSERMAGNYLQAYASVLGHADVEPLMEASNG